MPERDPVFAGRTVFDLIEGIHIEADRLRGVGVGSVRGFEEATTRALRALVELEARAVRPVLVDRLLAALAEAERAGWHCRVEPDPDVLRRCLHPGHPAFSGRTS